MAKTQRTVALATGGAGLGIATISDTVVNEFWKENDDTKRLLLFFVPFIVAGLAWAAAELVSIFLEIWPDFRKRLIGFLKSGETRRELNELKDFSLKLQIKIDHYNSMHEKLLEVRGDKKCSPEFRKIFQAKYEAAWQDKIDYEALGAKHGVRYNCSVSIAESTNNARSGG